VPMENLPIAPWEIKALTNILLSLSICCKKLDGTTPLKVSLSV